MLGLKPNVPIPTSPITIIHSCHCLHLQCVQDPFTDCNLDNSDSKVFKNIWASNYNEQIFCLIAHLYPDLQLN